MNIIKSPKIRLIATLFIFALSTINLTAQSGLKKLGIIYIDSKGLGQNPNVTQLTRIELGKLNICDVLDRYDIEDVLKRSNKKDLDCLGKECLIETGKLVKADYILSGSIERFGNKVLLMFREIDVQTGKTTHTVIKDYPDVTIDLEVMIEVALKDMYGIAITDPNKQNLEKKNKINTAVTNPDEATISIGGPRFGFAFFTGTAAEFMQRSKSQGGLGGYPALFQYGYQFEKMYLNEGNLQAIVEFIPMLSGMDQGRLLPSFTLLNGFRSAGNGWEFALGPTIAWSREAKGMYDVNGKWIRDDGSAPIDPKKVESRGDTRGDDIKTKPGLLIAVGKTFKSGKLNMPLNFYVVPRKSTMQFGVSYGFNALKNSTK